MADNRSVAKALVLVAVLLLVLQTAARLLEIGSPSTDAAVGDWTGRILIFGAAAVVLARAAAVERAQRPAWVLIGAGLGSWAAGDLYYSVALRGGEVPYPSIADACYLLMYVFVIAALRLRRSRSALSPGLVVVMLGVASVWSWLVFSGVLKGASGGTAATATTLAYPTLDLVLIASLLLAFADRGWRFERGLVALAVGFFLIALGDSIYALQITNGSYSEGTLIDALWPAGAVCIAVASWLRSGPDPARPAGDRDISGFVLAAIIAAIAIQLVDHFTRLDTVTTALSCLTMVAAVVQRVLLDRERRQARADVVAAEALHSASAAAALDCIVSIDGDGLVCQWNDAATRTFGYRPEDAVGRKLPELIIPPANREQHRLGLERVVKTGERRILGLPIEVMAMHADGSQFPVELTVTRVRADPPLFTGFLRDISDRRRREEQNERLAAIVRSSEDAILSKDLNGVVTAWNQGAERLYGYTAEEVIGKPLTCSIVPEERAEELRLVTERILAGVPVAFDTQRRCRNGELVDVALRAFPIRDLAGKIIGTSTSAHDITERLRREERERLDHDGRLWRGRVETALAEDHLMFWGQPVVELETGEVHHHELLLRMDLDGDVITPNRFLPHAESSGLITEVDRWAIRTGIAFAKRGRVAINLSAKSLHEPELIKDVRHALQKGVPARNVIFEITETAAVENLDAARRLVVQLTDLGCGVALDDFGTGYGSFTHLKHLPVTELKIDIDFVRDLVSDPTDQRLVRSIVSIAKAFGMKTVAEGVEDEATLELLRTLDVDFVQGYHVGYPAQMTVPRWPSSVPYIADAGFRIADPTT